MRLRPSGDPLWKWWWPIGGAAVAALLAIGFSTGWSAAWWAAAGVVAVVYVGAPVMAASLEDLIATRKQQPLPSFSESETNQMRPSPDAPTGGKAVSVPEPPPQPETAKVIAMTGRSPRSSGQEPARPWRKVGSDQFANLVNKLSSALPSVKQAEDTAIISGVTAHLIRIGNNDTAQQRWQAVLQQAIDDGVDDRVCEEALKLTKSEQLATAVADWRGEPGGP